MSKQDRLMAFTNIKDSLDGTITFYLNEGNESVLNSLRVGSDLKVASSGELATITEIDGVTIKVDMPITSMNSDILKRGEVLIVMNP